MSFHIAIQHWNHHHSQAVNLPVAPQSFAMPLCIPSPILLSAPTPRQPLICFRSLCISLCSLKFSTIRLTECILFFFFLVKILTLSIFTLRFIHEVSTRAHWNNSYQPILNLLVLSHLVLSVETTGKALVHAFSLLLQPPDRPQCRLMWPCAVRVARPLISGVVNKKLSFQWQWSPDLVASLFFNNKTYILKHFGETTICHFFYSYPNKNTLFFLFTWVVAYCIQW